MKLEDGFKKMRTILTFLKRLEKNSSAVSLTLKTGSMMTVPMPAIKFIRRNLMRSKRSIQFTRLVKRNINCETL